MALRLPVAMWRKWNAVDGASLAAAVAFYAILSLAPFVILIVAAGSVWLGAEETRHYLSGELAGLIGSDGARLVDRLITPRDLPSSLGDWGAWAGVALLAVGATATFAQLQHALDRIFGTGDRPPLVELVRVRALSFVLVLGAGVLLGLSLVASSALTMMVEHDVNGTLRTGARVNEIVSLGVAAIAMAALLRMLPDRPPRGLAGLGRSIVRCGALRRRTLPGRRIHRPLLARVRLRCRRNRRRPDGMDLFLDAGVSRGRHPRAGHRSWRLRSTLDEAAARHGPERYGRTMISTVGGTAPIGAAITRSPTRSNATRRARSADGELAQRQMFDFARQLGPVDAQHAGEPVDRDAEAGLQHHERGARRPCLRQARDRIADRRLAGAAHEAAIELGQPHAEMDRGVERARSASLAAAPRSP